MDKSDLESGNEVDISGPQDLFNDEPEEIILGSEENEAEEEPIKPKKEKSKAETENKPKPKKLKCSGILKDKHLSQPNGLPALKKRFEDFKFKGNGHEKEDLIRIMNILQQWMFYQLAPSYDFESCLHRLETLGKKSCVRTLMTKFRMGIEDWGERVPDDNHQDKKDDGMEISEPDKGNDDFDLLLNEEIANAASEDELNFTSGEIDTQQSMQKETEVTLTPEQLERIARNRKLAEERRMKRMSQQEPTPNKELYSELVADSETEPVELDK